MSEIDAPITTAIENCWNTYQALNEWIRFADTKAAVVLATAGVITTGAIAAVPLAKASLTAHPMSMGTAVVGLIGTGVAALLAVTCLTPSVSCTDPYSLIFFGTISKNHPNAAEYERAVLESFTDEALALRQISHQVWVNSCIASRKYGAATWAINTLVFAIALLLVSAVIALL